MTLTSELAEKVEALYRETLDKEFGGSPAFGPISVEPITDEEGQETFRVTIVFDGEEDAIDPRKALTVLTAMTTPLRELGLPPVLVESYVTKDEYPVLLEMRAEPPWGVEEE
jgi:hypothetical protein